MHFAKLDIAVLLAYLIGICGLGLYQAKKIKNSGDYFAGGRNFSKFFMIMHSLGSGTHADDPVGVSGAVYRNGLSGIWLTFAFLFVTPFYWILAPIFRRSRFLTITDFFEARFNSSLAMLYTCMAVLTFALNMGTMLKGTGTITTAITQGAVPEWLAISAMAVVFVTYGTAGGLLATVVAESVQGLLIVVMSFLLIPFGLLKVGGFAGIHHLLDTSKFRIYGSAEFPLIWIITVGLGNLIGVVSQPAGMEGAATGKTEWEGRIGFLGNYIKRFCALGWAVTGVIVLAMVANHSLLPLAKSERAFGVAIGSLLPVGFTGLMLAAILAAQMAALSSWMVAASALLSRNIYRRWLNPKATDPQVMAVARVSGTLIVLVGVGIAFIVPGVADALSYFWAISTLTGLSIWAGVLWKKANPTGAWASFLVMLVIWGVVGPIGAKLHHVIPGVRWLGMFDGVKNLHWLMLAYLPAGIVAMILGSLLGKPNDKKKIRDFFMLITTPVGHEQKLIDAGVDIVYAGQTKGHPWELNHGKLVNILGFVGSFLLSTVFLGLLWMIARFLR